MTMLSSTLYGDLEWITQRPEPFEFYTASELWTDEYTSEQMLAYHLNGDIDVSSRSTAFIDKSVAWLASRFNIGNGSRIIDFGCGPGLYTSRLAKLGATVSGVDFSTRSINYARERTDQDRLQVDYHNADYLQFQPDGKFDLVIMIMCDFCALSPAQRTLMLQKFSQILRPDGRIVLDVYSYRAFGQREESSSYEKNLLNGFWSPKPYYGFLNTFKYESEKVVLDKYTIIESDRMRQIYNWIQYCSVEVIEQEFTSSGLEIEEVIGNVSGNPFDAAETEFAVVARQSCL